MCIERVGKVSETIKWRRVERGGGRYRRVCGVGISHWGGPIGCDTPQTPASTGLRTVVVVVFSLVRPQRPGILEVGRCRRERVS